MITFRVACPHKLNFLYSSTLSGRIVALMRPISLLLESDSSLSRKGIVNQKKIFWTS